MKYLFTILAAMGVMFSCGGRGTASKAAAVSGAQERATSAPTAEMPSKPRNYTYRIVKELPHDPEAYTQGLFWHEGYLYEGTGRNGSSSLRKVDPATGRVVQSVELERKYFGEGIAMLDGLIYQLTWTEGRAFVYDAATFRRTGSFSYDGEGWGLTTDGRRLYMSDGSENIFVRDPATFRAERTITVTNDRRNLYYLNELEWIDGEIWANIYTLAEVVKIDPETGHVTGIIDFGGLQSPSDRSPRQDVFNGIAHDPATGNIYVTGKLWNKIYQVEIIEK